MRLADFRAFVVAHLASQVPEKAEAIEALKSNDDLLESGLVDSYALIDLCLAVEAWTGATIDIGVLEPEQFSSIEALLEVVNAKGGDHAEARATGADLAN
jgi:acyl carrier protein